MTPPQTRRWGSGADPAGVATPVKPPRPGPTTPHLNSGRPTDHSTAAGLLDTTPNPPEGRSGHDHARNLLGLNQSYPASRADARRQAVALLLSMSEDELLDALGQVIRGRWPDAALTTTTGYADALAQPETPHATGP